MKEKEVWRVNKEDVAFRLIKGWLSERFKKWLVSTGRRLNIEEDDLLLGIVETIRKISYKTIKILKQRTGKQIDLPLFIIAINPFEISAPTEAILHKNDPDFFCDKKQVEKWLDPLILLYLITLRRNQGLAELVGGRIILGAADGKYMGFYNNLVIKAVGDYRVRKNSDSENLRKLLRAVTEETFHCFCDQTGEFRNEEMKEEFSKIPDSADYTTQLSEKHKIEEKFGQKKVVVEIMEILKKDKTLFSPLEEKIKKTLPE